MTGYRDPCSQAPAADRHQYRVDISRCGFSLTCYFKADGALPRYYDGIIEGRNEVGFQLFAEVASNGIAILCFAIIKHDLGAASGWCARSSLWARPRA